VLYGYTQWLEQGRGPLHQLVAELRRGHVAGDGQHSLVVAVLLTDRRVAIGRDHSDAA
jgi:hypothetical protein